MYNLSFPFSDSGNGGFNGRFRGGNPNRSQDTQKSHSNGNHGEEDNQAAAESNRENEESNWQSHHRSGRGNSKSRQPNGEAAYMKNGYPREERRNEDPYPKRNNRRTVN